MISAFLSHGFVFHARSEGVKNSFRYPVFTLNFNVDSEEFVQKIFAKRFLRLLTFRSVDYLRGESGPVATRIRSFLKSECGYDAEDVFLQTFPRMLGYAFNPVSFWFCKKQGRLDAVLCEVNNTFGERHFYWVKPENGISETDWYQAEKVFHVSPFFPVEGYYRFRFVWQSDRTRIDIYYYGQDNQLKLATWIEGRFLELESNRILKILFRYGWMTPLVVLRIHWQALKLWQRRIRFYSKPTPPNKEITS